MGKNKGPRGAREKVAPVSKKMASGADARGKSFVRWGFAVSILLAILVAAYATIPSFRKWAKIFLPNKKAPAVSSTPRMPSPPLRQISEPAEPAFDDFAGSDACAGCHQEQYDLWKNSTHGRAGGSPGAKTVISRFDGTPLRFKDTVVIPAIQNQKYLFTVEQNGFPRKVFQVAAVIGGGHPEGGGTQSYFAEFPDGTLRFLPFDFIRKEKLWFAETKEKKGWIPISQELAITDLSEWPPSRILGAEPSSTNCQECHGSQIQVTYDLQKKRYVTRYKSLSINCESCHGPGKRHVELAQSGKIEVTEDIGMKSLATLTKDQSLEVCFQCHALKDVIQPGYLPGKNLQAYYALKFPILGENPYHPDGRIRAFAYQQNHLYSDCYLNGSMTCVDCHDPHSQKYRDINGAELMGKFDNRQCTGCHASKGLAPEQHSHHKAGSPGNLCTSCHAPYLQHKAMGSRLQFERADHTIPIPRPEFDARLGIENACQKCHADKTIPWLQAQAEAWYGQIKPHKDLIAGLMRAQNVTDRAKAAELVLNDTAAHPMAQVAGLSYFIENFLQPDMPALAPEIVVKLKRLCEQKDLDLKSLALMSLHFAQGHVAEAHAFLVSKLQALGEEEVPIRNRWAIALAHLASVYRARGDFANAIVTYRKALEIKPDDPATLLNLGITYGNNGEYENAITCYHKALAIKPDDAMALVNLGIAHRRRGEIEKAIDAYRQAIDINPWHPLAHFNLGNVYYEKSDFAKAMAFYQRAAELDPSLALAHFFLARACIKTGQLQQAANALRSGLQYDPNDEDAGQTLKALEAHLSKNGVME
jgi:tetratricopeptide (TPR) repeat protein